MSLFSQVTYYGGYSGEDPPLTIPNREVKLTIADGTDPPVGRVGSRRFRKPWMSDDTQGFFVLPAVELENGDHAVPPNILMQMCSIIRQLLAEVKEGDGGVTADIRLSASASGRKRACPQG